jgi:hypothetical protein
MEQASIGEIKKGWWLKETVKSVSTNRIVLSSGIAAQLDPFLVVDSSKPAHRFDRQGEAKPVGTVRGEITCVQYERPPQAVV